MLSGCVRCGRRVLGIGLAEEAILLVIPNKIYILYMKIIIIKTFLLLVILLYLPPPPPIAQEKRKGIEEGKGESRKGWMGWDGMR